MECEGTRGRSILAVIWIIGLLVAALAVVTAAALTWKRRLHAAEARRDREIAVVDQTLGRPAESIDEALGALIAARQTAENRADAMEWALERSAEGVMVLGTQLEMKFATGPMGRLMEGRGPEAAVAARIRALCRNVIASDNAVNERIEVFGLDRRVLFVHAEPLPAGVGPGVAVLVRDVTDQERVDAMGRDFFANVSHELKTPVGALSVLAEALTQTDDEATQRRLAERLETEAQRVAALVDDILDLSLVEAETPSFEVVDIVRAVDLACARVATAAEAAGVEVIKEFPNRPLTVKGEQRQLISAVANLLSNAIGYGSGPTDSGGRVWVRVSGDAREVMVEVEDQGVGIPERHLSRIFERFYRADAARSRGRGGTGLGLAIVRHVAMTHGGDVDVESAVGVGSTFRLRFPGLET